MSPVWYAPILKGKQNDILAFADLPMSTRAHLKPVFDMPFFSAEAQTQDEVSSFLERLRNYVPAGQPAFIDFYPLSAAETTPSGNSLIAYGFQQAKSLQFQVTPVLGLGLESTVFAECSKLVQGIGNGCCLRIDAEDIDGQSDEIATAVDERLTELGLARGDCDVLVDMRSISRLQFDVPEAIIDLIAALAQGLPIRTVIIAGSSALKDVTDVPMDGERHIAREELAIWDRVVFELSGSIVPIYGDYGVVHPDFATQGGGPYTNAKIRYSHDRQISYFRGHGLNRPKTDYAQYKTLAGLVASRPFFDGQSFSRGDWYISQVAAAPGPRGFGSPATWVRADMNRHIAHVARQLEHRAAGVLGKGSVAELATF